MIEQIKFALVNESGDIVPLGKVTCVNVEMNLESVIAETFTEICFRNNNISDSEIQTAEKFFFALNLKNYLEEMKENDRRPDANV